MTTPADPALFAATPAGSAGLLDAVRTTLAAVAPQAAPRTDRSPARLATLVADLDVCPEDPVPFDEVVADLAGRTWQHGVQVAHPDCAAHLHPPALTSAVATEVAIAAANQSLDSWDQAPAATELELRLVGWLAHRFGLPAGATGVVTSGGTASNLLGLTLARDRLAARSGVDVRAEGLPAGADRWRILASDGAHFSIQRSAALLGLGHRAVVPVATDGAGRMDPVALAAEVERLTTDGHPILAIVATAGTTDLGAVDPIAAVADVADAAGTWLHVDAAVGGAFVLSDQLRPLLAGIGRARSVTVDLHKLWWQPIGASVLLVADAGSFDAVRTPSAYLDRPDDDASGVTNLVSRSLDTTRRFDAAKAVTSLRATGRRQLGAMLDHLVHLATVAARAVDDDADLVLVAEPTTVMCTFRWAGDPAADVEAQVQRRLLASGRAIVGRTVLGGAAALKLTFTDPTTTDEQVRALVRLVADEARAVAAGP